jgi:hypothetical protein
VNKSKIDEIIGDQYSKAKNYNGDRFPLICQSSLATLAVESQQIKDRGLP